jgi:UDP-glucose 4-epimerase
MRVLLTGASSLTGYWFACGLHEGGHEVTATFTRPSATDYGDGVRGRRVNKVLDIVQPLFGCRFGDDIFLHAVREGFDLVCHHGADVTDYKSADFDARRALANNTHRLREVLTAMIAAGSGALLLTGSVFEGGEGAGSDGLPHLSPYGLSKALTAEYFEHYCRDAGITLGKFVIPNPFGPYEEPRFTTYLMRTWFMGETAAVRTPAYVRDNIHVRLLALAYVQFATSIVQKPEGVRRFAPSGYIESQGSFAQRFAGEMRRRLDMACEVELLEQTVFSEPRVRINTDVIDARAVGFDEADAWDELAGYYAEVLAGKASR